MTVSSDSPNDGEGDALGEKRRRFELSRIQIVGLVLSIAIPIALFAGGKSADLTGNVILGVALVILTQLVEIQISGIEREERMKAQVNKGLAEVRTANELGRLVGQVPEAGTNFVRLAGDLLSVRSNSVVPMRNIGLGRIADCARDVHCLSEGFIRVPLNDKNSAVASGLYRKASAGIEATSVGSLDYWITSRFAQKYLADFGEMTARGVPIERVFITSAEDLAQNRSILERQYDLGIRVWTAIQGEVPNELIEDYLIIDDLCYTRREFSNSGRAVREYLTVDLDEIADAKRRFVELKIYCEEFST